MTNHVDIISWATSYLSSKNNFLIKQPDIIQETPWSNVIRLSTQNGFFYLKQPTLLLAKEAVVIEYLYHQLNANVPYLVAVNEDMHCFLMKDAGQTLRQYINGACKPSFMNLAIKHFAAFQRSTENHIESLFKLDIPDWRLTRLPFLYEKIINDTEFLKADGMTNKELDQLQQLSPLVTEQLRELSLYGISETVVQPDFNTNNILISPETQQFTVIDLGELSISHPFFSLHNFLYYTTIHHAVKEQDKTWEGMLDACIENWSDLLPKAKLLEGYNLSKTLWPIYSACVNYHFMHCVDIHALNAWYTNKPNRLARAFRQYIASYKCL